MAEKKLPVKDGCNVTAVNAAWDGDGLRKKHLLVFPAVPAAICMVLLEGTSLS